MKPETVRATTRLVGRDGELAALDAVLSDVLDGRQEIVLLAGEAGIGKTSLARELGARARLRGATVVWGAGWDGGGAPAMWPWAQVVRELLPALSREQLLEDVGTGAPWLAAVSPDLRAALGDVPDPPAAEGEHARFRLLDALARFLGANAARTPLVIVLDDLHWMDEPSLRALELIGRTLHDVPLLVAGTYRDDEARRRADLDDVLGGLRRTARSVPLRGLSEAAVGELVAHHAGAAPQPELVRTVHGVSAGNPFFADELLRLLLANGHQPTEEGLLPLPAGVAETIRRRLVPLQPETERILTVAAVIGGEFRLGTLAAAAGVELSAALAAVDEATRAGLVTGAPGGRRSHFAHALVRETLMADLLPGERSALHADVARALIDRYGDSVEEHLPELAFHVLEAVPHIAAEEALRYALDAGHHAVARFDYAEGARLFDRAADLRDVLGPDDVRDADVYQALGEARMRAGDIPGGRKALARAAAAARRLGDPMRVAQAALAYAPWGYSPGVVEDDVVDLLAEAVDVLDEAGGNVRVDSLRARLRARLASALYWSPETERRRLLVEEATTLARGLRARVRGADVQAADETLAYVLGQGFVATWSPDTSEGGVATAEELLAICERTGDLERELNTRSRLVSLLSELDDLPSARRHADAFAELAARLRQPRMLFYVPLHEGMSAILEGRWEDAERSAMSAAELGAQVPGTLAPMLSTAQLGIARVEQDRGAEIEVAVRAFADRHPAMPAWRAALVVVLAQAGKTADARDQLERLAARDFADLPRDTLWFPAMWLLARAVSELGDAARARRLHELLEPYAVRNVVSPEAGVFGPVSLALATLAATAGEQADALAYLGTRPAASRRARARGPRWLGRRSSRPDCAATTTRHARGRWPRRRRAARKSWGWSCCVREPPSCARTSPTRPRRRRRRASPGPGAPAVLRREGDVWAMGMEGCPLPRAGRQGARAPRAAPGPARGGAARARSRRAGRGRRRRPRGRRRRRSRPGAAPRRPSGHGAGPRRGGEALLSRAGGGAAGRDRGGGCVQRPRARREGARGALLDRRPAHRRGGSRRPRSPHGVGRRARAGERHAGDPGRARRVQERDAELGRSLQATVRTGTFCSYEPDPAEPLQWTVQP